MAAAFHALEEHTAALPTARETRRKAVALLVEEYGAVESARGTAHALVEQAQAELDVLPKTPERETLRRAAEYVLSRDR